MLAGPAGVRPAQLVATGRAPGRVHPSSTWQEEAPGLEAEFQQVWEGSASHAEVWPSTPQTASIGQAKFRLKCEAEEAAPRSPKRCSPSAAADGAAAAGAREEPKRVQQ